MELNAMKILNLLTVFLLCSSFCSVLSYPSRPLNERTTELALQEAWLLIDDQNQSKQNLPDMMRRKIVAKSVFIAPTFKPDELPPCADGYTSDSMGRCVRIIQLDPDEHLKFLFQKLIGNFGAAPNNQQEEGMPTSGPVQFSIDLDLTKNSQEESDDSLKSTDVALVFTTNNMQAEQNSDERVDDDSEMKTNNWKGENTMENLNFSFVPAPTNGSFDTEKIDVKNEEKTSEDTETTTTIETEATTEAVFSTTLNFGDETSTITKEAITTITTETTTLPPELFTELDENHSHALFFKVPSSAHLESETKTSTSSSSRIKFEEDTMNNDQPEMPDSTNVDDVSSKVVFRDPVTYEHSSDTGDLMMSENVRHPSHRIRFPGEREQSAYSDSFYQIKRPQRQNQKHRHTQTNTEIMNDRLHFSLESTTERRLFNHRNRDKHFWRVPSTWRESSPKRSLVLRFSKMPGEGNITLSDINHRGSRPLYRQVRIEDLSYIFGHRRKRSNNS